VLLQQLNKILKELQREVAHASTTIEEITSEDDLSKGNSDALESKQQVARINRSHQIIAVQE
jgi:hypothetical protein